MNLKAGIFGESSSYAHRLVHAAAVLALAAVAVLLALTVLAWAWPAWVAIASVLLVAYRVHPGVRVHWFFMRPRWRFTVLAGLAGLLLRVAITSPLSGTGAAGFAVGGLALAGSAGIAFFIVKVFEGTAMTKVFELIPPAQRDAFANFLAAGSADASGGKTVDFSSLDEAAITRNLKARVVGQDQAIDQVVPTLFTRAKLPRKDKPVAVFLFVGPSGVGKTELAKGLADELFGEKKLVRIDMSEYQDAISLDRLIGVPAGYKGSEEGGWLPRQMQRVGGTGVLLLDEVEKAHPVIMRALLSLLDEARITEASTQRVYRATGFVIVLTSNLHQEEIGRIAATIEDPQEASARIKDELRTGEGGFSPEQLGRVDAIFPFRSLGRADIAAIIGQYLASRAAGAGLALVGLDSGLLVDLILKHEKDASGGVRGLQVLAESMVLRGFADARDAGAKEVAIRVRDGRVLVEQIEKMEVTK